MIMTAQIDLTTTLLQPLETATVPSSATAAVIRDYFRKNSVLRFSTVWAEFKNRFFDKTENPATEMTYRKHKLLHVSADGPIIAELGGETKVEGTFTAAYALLKRQPDGEAGFLQTNGYANIFYVKDKKGELCAIRVGWARDGWVIDAISVQDPLAWNGQHAVFCPL
jgi:hypothetical protein